MMKKSIRQLIRSFTLLAFIGMSSFLTAQNMLKGNVKDQDGEALIGVTVSEKGSTNGTMTDVNGNYKLSFTKSEITVLFRYVGFAEVENTVTASTGTLDVSMDQEATQMDQVVITGLGTSVKRSNLANSVDYIDAKQLTGIASQSTMDGALYGKFKGANITSNSGAPGGGMSIRLRGVTAVLGSKQPIYIVDGVFLDNSSTSFGNDLVSSAAGGGNQGSNQDDATNRIADIDPEDIESIEILKGSSAAAIYGAKAANGVVIITTKKGQEGKPRINYSQTLGFTQAIRLLGTRDWNEQKVFDQFFDPTDTTGASLINANQQVALFNQNGINDYEKELYGGSGFLSTSRVSVSGKKGGTSYFLGGTIKKEDGIVENTGYDKSSIRANISQRFSDFLSMDFTSNYIVSQTDKGFFNNSNFNTTVGYALAFTYPWEELYPDNDGNYPIGGAGSNVLETVNKVTNREEINRFIGGLKLNFNLLKTDNQALKLSVFGGYDNYALRTLSDFPQSLTYFGDGQALDNVDGARIGGSGGNINQNSNAILVHTYYTPSKTSFRTQLGLTQESTDYDFQRIIASDINGSQTSLDQSSIQTVTQNRRDFIDQGFFAQEEVNFNDKIVLTAGIRGDKSTRNSDIDKYFFYPKANIAANLHNIFDIGGEDSDLSSLKVRVAYGEAGIFAPYGSKNTAYQASNIDGASGLISQTVRGNPDIGPQRNKELELGFDVSLYSNKVFLDFTYYTRESVDFLLQADVPLSSGYVGTLDNAGDLVNKGVEIGLNVDAMNTEDFSWNSGINWWKNKSEVTRLAVEPTTTGGFANSLGTYYIQEGSSITQIVGTVNRACDTCDPDGDGLQVYGDAEPYFNMSFINNLSYKNFDLSFLLHWKNGGSGINLSTFLYDLAGTTWDYDETTLDPDGELNNASYRVGSRSQFGNITGFIESTTYLRLREIALYYKIPTGDSKFIDGLQVGVSGRNLINIFNYNSYDPEVSNFGNDALGNSVEVTPFPSTKRYSFHLRANF